MGEGSAGDSVVYGFAASEALPGMVDLCRACYGERAEPEEWWRWRFFSSDPSSAAVAVATQGDVLVGMQPLRIEPFRHGDQRLLGAAFEGAMVRRGWRGRGVFSRLVSAALESAWARGAAFAYSMPNERSYPAFLKAGWWDLGERQVLVRPLLPQRVRGPEGRGVDGITATAVPRFGDGLGGLLGRDAHASELEPERRPAWLEWRYGANPAAGYTLVEARGPDGDLVAIGVGRVLRIAGFRVGVVVQWAGAGAGLRAALRGLEAAFRLDGALLSLAVVAAASQATALSQHCYWRPPDFLPRRRLRTVCMPRPGAAPALWPPRGVESWRLSLGDWDGV